MNGNPQLTLPASAIALGIECDEIIVEQPAGIESVHVLDADPAPDWTLKLKFRVGGTMAAGFVASTIPGEVLFYYEGFGGDPEGMIGPVAFDSGDGVSTGGMVWEYNVTSDPQLSSLLPAGTVAKLSAVVRFPSWNVNAFLEGQSISQATP